MNKMKRNIFFEEDKLGIGNSIYDFDFLKYLGGGNTYHYAKVRSKLNNKIYTMKIITNIEFEKYKLMEKKLHILKLFKRPNILEYYSSFIENNNYYIVMEYVENGSLKSYIKIHKILNKVIEENKINKIMYQLMSALTFLHKEGYLHRNLSTSNIFLSENDNIKLGGFEYLCGINDENEISIKPKEHIWLEKNLYSYKDDIYSLGLIFYNLKYLHPKHVLFPVKDNKNKEIYIFEDFNLKDTQKLKNNKLYSEYYKLLNNDNQNIDEIILKNYSNFYGKNLNTSIESVYFSLLNLFQNPHIKRGPFVEERKININREFLSDKPITQTLKITNLSAIRSILIEQNKSFSKYENMEIPPSELIKFLITQLHKENNTQNNQGSIISDKNKGLIGINEIKVTCLKCRKYNSYLEMCYYIIIDLDAAEKPVDFSIFEEENIEIKTYKFCEDCQTMSEHIKSKRIIKFPCRLVVLVKNNSKKKLQIQLTFKNWNYFLIGTINYNEEKYSYEYSYFILNEDVEQRWKHPKNEKLNNNNINNKNVIAMFFLYVGKD